MSKKVFLNAGHAIGLDPGCVNNNHDLTEAEICADIAELVEQYLKAVGYDVYSMQSDNLNGGKYNYYYSVVATANRWEPDVFVSIHCNAASYLAQGTETFAFNAYCKGNKLAYCVQRQLINSLDVVDRGVKYANFAVLREVECPSILVETAFLTNEHDAQILMNKKDEIARAIARGITDYFEVENE